MKVYENIAFLLKRIISLEINCPENLIYIQEGNIVKRNLAIFILALTLIFSGCGASSDNVHETSAQSSVAMSEEVSMDVAAEGGLDRKSTATGVLEQESDTPRKVVKNSRMNMETKEFDDAIPYIINLVEEKGGYIQSQSIDGTSLYNNGRYCRSANIIARIPAEQLEDTQTQLSKMFNIVNKNDYIDDITDNYYDIVARLNTLKAQETKLLELLDKAQELSDVIELEKALTDCRTEIDATMGRIKRMDNQVAYSTVTMQIDEVIDYQEVNSVPLTFGERVKQSFGIGISQLKEMFINIFFFALEDLPVILVTLLIWGAVIWFAVWVFRKISKKIRGKKPNYSKPNNYQNSSNPENVGSYNGQGYESPKYNIDEKQEDKKDK